MDKVEYEKGYQDAINALRDIINGGNGDPNSPSNPNSQGGQQGGQQGGSQSGQQGGTGLSTPGGKDQQDNASGGEGGEGSNGAPKKGTKPKPAVDGGAFEKAAKEGEKRGTRKKSKPGEGQEEADSGSKGQGGSSGWGNSGHGDDTQRDYVKKQAEEVIKKYRNRLSGEFGEFVNKCRVSANEASRPKGMVTYAKKAAPHWDKAFKDVVETYITQQVDLKHREMEATYSRVKRGSGFVKFGKPIQPGQKVRDDKLNITMAYYIDRSGSMQGSIDNVFSLAYELSKMIHKQNKGDKVVGEFDFKYYAFDTEMIEVTGGKKVSAGGGTMSLDEILKHMLNNTKDYLVNIIITDAEFDIQEKQIRPILKQLGGMCVIIANHEKDELRSLEKKERGKFAYILADENFSLK